MLERNAALLPKEGNTLLHLACKSGLSDVVTQLVALGENLEARNAEHASPLILSISHNHYDIASLLLNNGANPNPRKGDKEQAFLLAMQKKAYPLVELMLSKKLRVNSDLLVLLKKHKRDNPGNDQLAKLYEATIKPYKENRLSLKEKDNREIPAGLEAKVKIIAAAVFCEDADFKCLLINKINEIYIHSDILRPMLDIVSLACKGIRGKSKKDQAGFLKILVCKEKDIGYFSGDKDVGGLSAKNNIYLGGGSNINFVLGVLLHEMKHLVDAEIYDDKFQPYKKSSEVWFKNTQEYLKESLLWLPSQSKDEKSIVYFIDLIFKGYEGKEQEAEIMTQVPEIIGLLGSEKGNAWLNKYLPDLINYYETYFNADCKQYLAEKNTNSSQFFSSNKRLRNEESAAILLEANKENIEGGVQFGVIQDDQVKPMNKYPKLV